MLSEDLLVQGSGDNVFTESITTFTVKMTEKLSLAVDYKIRNNSDTPAGVEKTDTITSVNLVSSF